MMTFYKIKSQIIDGVRVKTRVPLTDKEEQQRLLAVAESEKAEQ